MSFLWFKAAGPPYKVYESATGLYDVGHYAGIRLNNVGGLVGDDGKTVCNKEVLLERMGKGPLCGSSEQHAIKLTGPAPPPPQANSAMTTTDYAIQDVARVLRELFWGSKSNQKAVEPAEACAGLVSPNPHQPHMIVHSGVRKRTAYSHD